MSSLTTSAVVLGGVDVVDAELDGAAQDGQRGVAVARRPKTAAPLSCIAPKPMQPDVVVAELRGLVRGHAHQCGGCGLRGL